MNKQLTSIATVTVLAALMSACGGSGSDTVDNATDAATEVVVDARNAASVAVEEIGEKWEAMDWDQAVSSAQDKWQELTTEDLARAKGSAADMVAVLKEKYEVTEEQARAQIAEWMGSL